MPAAREPPGEPASAPAPRPARPLAAAPSRRRDKGLLHFENPPELDLDLRERLLDLAYDVSSYIRQHAHPAIRISAALLLAASIAACSSEPQRTSVVECAAASGAPLGGEVREGLPTAPGRYPIVATSLARDAEGVYHFRWLNPGASAGSDQPARASRLQLARSDGYELEVPAAGDPVLHVRENSQFALCGRTGSAAHSSYFGYWRPFYIGGGYLGPGYYDPPPRTASTNGHLDGSRYSANPRPIAERTFSVPGAVSGRAGGAGGGAAATKKAGLDPAASGGKTGVAAPKSSGFSAGKAGGGGGGGGG